MRQKRFVLFSLIILLLALAGIVVARQYITLAIASQLSQDEVIQNAKEVARANGLVGEPSKVSIAQMTYEEFERLRPDVVSYDNEESSKSVWVIVMEGDILSEAEPGMSGETAPPIEFDNIYIVLDAVSNEVIEVGSRTPEHEIILPK
jgi:hypothetical protein